MRALDDGPLTKDREGIIARLLAALRCKQAVHNSPEPHIHLSPHRQDLGAVKAQEIRSPSHFSGIGIRSEKRDHVVATFGHVGNFGAPAANPGATSLIHLPMRLVYSLATRRGQFEPVIGPLVSRES